MTKRKKRRRRAVHHFRRMVTMLAALFLAAAAFVIEYHGGQDGIPTWSQLYTALGVPTDGPDAELLAETQTTVTMLDVGQGDSVLIGQDGEYCLIDTGTADSQQSLVRSLRQADITTLKYLILTHPHADHTGGVLAVLENLRVDTLVIPVWESEETSPWPEDMLRIASLYGTTVTETGEGDSFPLGTGALQVLQGGSAWMQGEDDVNNGSLCLLFEAGDFRYLATGDAEEDSEAALVERYGSHLQAVLYKAGHHGSSTSNTGALLSTVQPQAVAISCGVDNEYGHPSVSVLRRMEEAGVSVYRTDTMGTITFTYESGVLKAVLAGSEELDAAA